MAAAFEDIYEAHQVAVDVGVRVLQGVAHASLGCEVDNALERRFCEQARKAVAVGYIQFDEAEMRMRAQARQPVFFQGGIVIVIEIVDSNYFVATRKQAFNRMHADETCGSGNKDFH
jgi:hypothetical protein